MPQFCGVSGFRYTGLSVSPQDWGENDFQTSRKLTGNQNPPRSAAVNQCYLGSLSQPCQDQPLLLGNTQNG